MIAWMRTVAVGVTALLLALTSTARADDVAADTLFAEARALMERGDYERACPKLAASYKLDPTLGTLLNLALCHERIGRVATASAEYERAIDLASAAHDSEALAFATEREQVIKPRVPHLTIAVDPSARVAVSVNGVAIEARRLGTPLAFDPGDFDVRAIARGKVAWSKTVHLDEGAIERVDVPTLAYVAVREPPRRDHRALVIGLAAGGLSIGVGSILGVLAKSRWDEAKPHCMPDATGFACDSTGLELSHRASAFAIGSTAAIGVGIAVAAAGVTLHLYGRRGRRPDVALVPIGVNGARVQLSLSF
jgi:hypothetical protein